MQRQKLAGAKGKKGLKEISKCPLKLLPRGKFCLHDFDHLIHFISISLTKHLKSDRQQRFKTKDDKEIENTQRHIHLHTHKNVALSRKQNSAWQTRGCWVQRWNMDWYPKKETVNLPPPRITNKATQIWPFDAAPSKKKVAGLLKCWKI